MATSNQNKHLTLAERIIIETGIQSGATKAAIAKTIGKDNSTIGKEIALHRQLTRRCRLPLECSNYKTCKHGRQCFENCPDFKQFKCSRRDRSPGACNGCSVQSHCRFNKYYYNAQIAQKQYEKLLVETREGLDLLEQDIQRLATIVVPAIKQGHSPYHIIQNNKELGLSEKTLYNYIAKGVFRPFGVLDIDLRLKTKRKMTKKQTIVYKKRKDNKYLKGRTYQDYLNNIKEEPDINILQMDTIYNEQSGPFIQTFKLLNFDFLFGIFHETKSADDMNFGIDLLETIIGRKLFQSQVEVILTDRGSEFTDAEYIEIRSDSTIRTRIFYCDPMASGQKGSLEKRHAELRYIIPKGISFAKLSLTNQDKLNLALSHVNSSPRKKSMGKTPFELLRFYCPELLEKFLDFGLKEIAQNLVILKPYLIK